MVKDMSLYNVLGVPADASIEDIRRAYRGKLCISQVEGFAINEKKKLISAFEVLSDENKRKQYDKEGLASGHGTPDSKSRDQNTGVPNDSPNINPLHSLLRMFADVHRPKELVVKVDLTLEEMYFGCERSCVVRRDIICPMCSGRGGRAQDYVRCSTCEGRGWNFISLTKSTGAESNGVGLKGISRSSESDTMDESQKGKHQVPESTDGVSQQAVPHREPIPAPAPPPRQREGSTDSIGSVHQMQCYRCHGNGRVVETKCQKCRGKMLVRTKKVYNLKIAKGVQNCQRVMHSRQGNESPGQEPGDLVFILQEIPHPAFTRRRHNLHMQVQLTLLEALCGFHKVLQGLDRRPFQIRSQSGEVFAPGTKRRILGRGMPRGKSNTYGDLVITFHCDITQKIDLNAEALAQLQSILQSGPRKEEETIPQMDEEPAGSSNQTIQTWDFVELREVSKLESDSDSGGEDSSMCGMAFTDQLPDGSGRQGSTTRANNIDSVECRHQ